VENQNLPIRFWHQKDLPDGFEGGRRFLNLKSTEFKKIYNKHVNPYLRKKGFKVSGFKAVKEDELNYYMVFWGTGKYGGDGTLEILIHPKGLPSIGHSEWTDSKANEAYQYIFRKPILLPNGNMWIDIGINEDEAIETCEYLLRGLEGEYDKYVESFAKYPQELLAITAGNFDKEYLKIYNDFGLSFHFEPRYEAALWLSIIHCANNNDCSELVEIAKKEFIERSEGNGLKVLDDHMRIKYMNGLKEGKLF
jgi:hypothetical protein